MRNLLILLFFAVSQPVCFASLEDALNATCKVSTKQGAGSGVVYAQDDKHFYIGTAAHVILNNKNEALASETTFYNNGFRSHKIKSEIMFWAYKEKTVTDFAIIRVKKEDFRNYPHPKPVPFAKKDYNIDRLDVVISYGCARGGWPTGWKGHVTETSPEGIKVKPFPIQGRSGSAVFNEDASRVLGIIVWRNGYCISNRRVAELWEEAALIISKGKIDNVLEK